MTSAKTTYVEIAVNLPHVSGVFHYHVPTELEGEVAQGCLVVVPFGKQHVQGIVLGFVEHPFIAETRPVLEIVDPHAVVTPQQIELARAMSARFLAPLSMCLGVMLPPGLDQQADALYTLIAPPDFEVTPAQQRLIQLLQKRGPLRGKQLDRALSRMNWRSAARSLMRRGVLQARPYLGEPKVRAKKVRTAQLTCPLEVAMQALAQARRAGTQALARRREIVKFLASEAHPVAVPWVYAHSGGNLNDLRFLEARGLVHLGWEEVWRDPLEDFEVLPTQPPPLTHDQQKVWEEVRQALSRSLAGESVQPMLLHGVTSSGKTEIYLHAVEFMLQHGRQAIVLVPEIALTPQTIQRFLGRFAGQVGLIHSALSMGERYDTWRRARAGEISVVVGPRSALFTPFERLGLIVVDECHDDSYYQSEAPPHYHALEAAVMYAEQLGGVCLAGSATPDVVSRYRCEQGEWRYLHLPLRILAHRQAVEAQMQRLRQKSSSASVLSRYQPLEGEAESLEMPKVHVVDMRQELREGNRSIFSLALQSALARVLEQEQQAILFLNRRGSATFVFCRDCGYTLKCPHCDIPLTFHESQNRLQCHFCHYQRLMPSACPECGGKRIRQYGSGTQSVETQVRQLFPQARTLRWDYETTRFKGAHQAILQQFRNHQADVLIGTQMLAKGLDLPLVTLVGVVLADVGLSFPDYRAGERLFQVLTQVAGRAGRSPLGGEVILQTFQPHHYVIQAASQHDYERFYRQELTYRRELIYPPFAQIVRLEYRHIDATRAEEAAKKLAAQLHRAIEEQERRMTRLIGPAPCFFSRIAGFYRWHILVVGPDPRPLLRNIPLADWKIEVNPPSLL